MYVSMWTYKHTNLFPLHPYIHTLSNKDDDTITAGKAWPPSIPDPLAPVSVHFAPPSERARRRYEGGLSNPLQDGGEEVCISFCVWPEGPWVLCGVYVCVCACPSERVHCIMDFFLGLARFVSGGAMRRCVLARRACHNHLT